jgi:hypothetical protein
MRYICSAYLRRESRSGEGNALASPITGQKTIERAFEDPTTTSYVAESRKVQNLLPTL